MYNPIMQRCDIMIIVDGIKKENVSNLGASIAAKPCYEYLNNNVFDFSSPAKPVLSCSFQPNPRSEPKHNHSPSLHVKHHSTIPPPSKHSKSLAVRPTILPNPESEAPGTPPSASTHERALLHRRRRDEDGVRLSWLSATGLEPRSPGL